MFANDLQINRCCIVLLKRIRLPLLWTDNNPTSLAIEWKECSPLSSGETIILRTCFDFWNGSGNVTVAELMALDEGHRRCIADLIVASLDSRDVEAWIEKWGDS